MNPYTLRKTLRALRDRPASTGCRWSTSSSPAAPTCRPRPNLHPRRADLPRPDPAVGAWRSRRSRWCSATRPRAARTCPGMCDYAVMVDEPRQGVPRRAAAGEDGDRRGRRRRGARRRRHARPRRPGSPTTSPSTSTTRIRHRPRRSWRGSTGASSARRPTEPRERAALRPRRAARHRVRPTSRCPSTPARCSPASSTARGSTSSSRATARASSRAGRRSTATRSASSPTARGVLFSEEAEEGHRVHPAGQPDRHPAAVPPEHHRLHGRHGVRAGRDHQGRRQDDQRGHQQRGAAPDGDHGRLVRRRATTACAAAPTTRGSCSPGRTRRSR